MKKLSEIQPALDRIKDEALIGLEYIVELISEATKPTFQCVLCNNRANNNPQTILHHITSCNHRLKYLEKHFPAIVREIALFRFNNDARSEMPRILQMICKAIEGTHGRLTPSVYEYNSYLKSKEVCLREIVAGRHFDETFGVTFMNVINRKTILDTISSGCATGCRKSDISATTVRALKKLYNRGYPYVSVENVLPVYNNSTLTSTSDNVDHKRKSNWKGISKSCNKSDKNVDDESRDENEKKRKLPQSSECYQESSEVSLPKSLRQDKRDADTIDFRSVWSSSSVSSTRVDSSRDTKKSQMSSTSKELDVNNDNIARDRYKWEQYRFMVESAMTELNKAHKEHEQSPENHPLYYTELNKFRNQRYKELQAAKINPTTHDLRSEWTIHWTRCLKEMHNESVEKKKAEFRTKLNLPDEAVQTDEFNEARKEQYAPAYQDTSQSDSTKHLRNSRTLSRPCRRSPRSRSRSVGRNEFEHLSHGSRTRSQSRNYHDSEDYDCYGQQERRTSPGPDKLDVQQAEYEPLTTLSVLRPRSSPRSLPRNRDSGGYDYYGQDERRPERLCAEEVEDEPLTTLSVLRLLTALEDLLGSLGPKAIDLLTKALALEKVKRNSADDLLLIEDNCLILETIKEKLKGQLIAGLIEPKKINIVRRAVRNVESIIYLVFEKPKDRVFEKRTKTTMQVSSSADTTLVSSSTVDLTDKVAVSEKKADALITPCETVEQLEECIGVHVQQKAKESSEPLTTTTSLLQEPQSLPMTDNIYDFPLSPKTSTRKSSYLDDELQHTSLTDSNLQILLKNFKNLSTDEQQHLIAYLKNMKNSEPARIAKLRKSVNADTNRLMTSLMGSTKAKNMHSNSIRIDNAPAHTETQIKSVGFGQQRSTHHDESSDTVYSSLPTSALPEANKFNYNYMPYFMQGYGLADQNNQPYPVQYPNVNVGNPYSVQTETQNQSIPMYQLPSSSCDQTLQSMQSSSSISNVYDANNGNYNYMPYFLQGYGLVQQNENNEPWPVQYPNVTNALQTQNETQTQSIPMDLSSPSHEQTSISVQGSPTPTNLSNTNNDNFNYLAYFPQGYDLMWQKKDNQPCPVPYPNVADPLSTNTETETQFTSMYQLPKTDQYPNPPPTQIQTKSVPFYQLPSTYYHKPLESIQSSSAVKCDSADPRIGKGIYKSMDHPQQENRSTEQNNQPYMVQYPTVKYPNQNMERFYNPMIQQIETGNQQSNPMIQCIETGNQPSNSMIQRIETGNQPKNPMTQQTETVNLTKNPQQNATGNQERGSKKTRWSA